MQVIGQEDGIKLTEALVVTDGMFDGLHLGHVKILERIKELARKNNAKSCVLTYWPHPRLVLKPEEKPIPLLTSLEEKLELLEKMGIDYCFVIPFTNTFSKMPWLRFVEDILVQTLNTKLLVIGYNHRFGHNREGNIEQLRAVAPKYQFEIEEISKQELEMVAISSTQIRNAISSGAIKTANEFLGHTYSLKGKVVKGRQLGRTIGFPTANIKPTSAEKIIPADGVYAVEIEFNNQQFYGMLNIGMKPTVGGLERTIEVHIFDFEADIYEEILTIFFVAYLRKEQKFDGLEGLKSQLANDKLSAMQMLQQMSKMNSR